jgi:hypothetical protein
MNKVDVALQDDAVARRQLVDRTANQSRKHVGGAHRRQQKRHAPCHSGLPLPQTHRSAAQASIRSASAAAFSLAAAMSDGVANDPPVLMILETQTQCLCLVQTAGARCS